MQRILTVSVLAILAVPGMAWAADAAGSGDMAKAFAVLAAGLGFGLAAGLCGLGQGRAAGSAVDAMARQPGAIARIQTAMLLGLAFIESLVLFVFVVGFLFPLKILVAFIQTFIFCKLAMLYIAAAVEEAEHH